MNTKYNKILGTTINLFVKNGIKKTTMDDLAQSANVSKVTIYKYFGGKDSLYHIVGKSILDEYIAKIEQHVNSDASINTIIELVMDTLSELIISNKLTLCKDLVKLNDELEKDYEAFEKKYKDIVLLLIASGKRQDLIKQDIKDEYVFYYIDMGLSYFEHNMKYRNKVIHDSEFEAEFMAFLLGNIFNK